MSSSMEEKMKWIQEKKNQTPVYYDGDRPFYRSWSKNKKYATIGDPNDKGVRRIIHFGDKRYEHYRDKIGLYKYLDHNDPKRRKEYYDRHGSSDDPTTAKFFSNKYLW